MSETSEERALDRHKEYLKRELAEIHVSFQTGQNGMIGSGNGVTHNGRMMTMETAVLLLLEGINASLRGSVTLSPAPVRASGASKGSSSLRASGKSHQLTFSSAIRSNATEVEGNPLSTDRNDEIMEEVMQGMDDSAYCARYDREEHSAMFDGESYMYFADESSYQKKDNELAKKQTRRYGGLTTLAQSKKMSQLTQDNVQWEDRRLIRSGAVRGTEVQTEFDYEDERKVVLLVHDTKPPFLDGLVVFAKQAESVKNPTSDVAIMARNGSALVREIREKHSMNKSCRCFWELASSKLGDILGVGKSPEQVDADKAKVGEEGEVDFNEDTNFAQHMIEKAKAVSEFAKSKSLTQQRHYLSIFSVRDDLLQVVSENQVVVDVGETGSGKTQLTQYMTNGVLLREALKDADLDKYRVIIMDEAHGRSLNTDVLFGTLKKVVVRLRDFKLIVTSATLNTRNFSDFFGSVPTFHTPDRTFPGNITYSKTPCGDYVEAAFVLYEETGDTHETFKTETRTIKGQPEDSSQGGNQGTDPSDGEGSSFDGDDDRSPSDGDDDGSPSNGDDASLHSAHNNSKPDDKKDASKNKYDERATPPFVDLYANGWLVPRYAVIEDLTVLACKICFNPFQPPITQCKVGHCICQPCFRQYNERCSECRDHVLKECKSMEDVMGSCYAICRDPDCEQFGSVLYRDVDQHKKICTTIYVFCPLCERSFKKSYFVDHLENYHEKNLETFCYEEKFEVTLDNRKYIFLNALDDEVFVIVCVKTRFHVAFHLFCVRADDRPQTPFLGYIGPYGIDRKNLEKIDITSSILVEPLGDSELSTGKGDIKAISVVIEKKNNVQIDDTIIVREWTLDDVNEALGEEGSGADGEEEEVDIQMGDSIEEGNEEEFEEDVGEEISEGEEEEEREIQMGDSIEEGNEEEFEEDVGEEISEGEEREIQMGDVYMTEEFVEESSGAEEDEEGDIQMGDIETTEREFEVREGSSGAEEEEGEECSRAEEEEIGEESSGAEEEEVGEEGSGADEVGGEGSGAGEEEEDADFMEESEMKDKIDSNAMMVKYYEDYELVVISTDPLNCSKCRLPLTPMIYQCQEGHWFCEKCSQTDWECETCGAALNNRNIALECVISAALVRCSFVGCSKKMPYFELIPHHRTCSKGVICCKGCGEGIPPFCFSDHVLQCHSDKVKTFRYNVCENVIIGNYDYLFFMDENKQVFVVMCNGYAITIALARLPCLGPKGYSFILDFSPDDAYEEEMVVSSTLWSELEPHDDYRWVSFFGKGKPNRDHTFRGTIVIKD